MWCRLNCVVLGMVGCLLLLNSIAVAADKVVVVPLGNRLFSGDQYQTISSAAFTPDNQNTTYVKPQMYGYSGYLQLTSLAGAMAPVILPDGATISQLSLYMEDSAGRCDLRFAKRALSDKTPTEICFIPSPEINGGAYTAIHEPIASETIDNQNYQYYLSWDCSLFGGDKLYAVRIKYNL